MKRYKVLIGLSGTRFSIAEGDTIDETNITISDPDLFEMCSRAGALEELNEGSGILPDVPTGPPDAPKPIKPRGKSKG